MSRVSSLEVSVVVCAYTLDRWADIVAGVEALAGQSVPPLETLLVIDGNPELLSRAHDAFPQVRVVANTRAKGISGARNSGIAEAKGAVVAFLDDDARPEPDWVERLLAPYADPSVMAVGGKAVPAWPDRRPDHLAPELDWVVGCTYQGMPVEQADVRNVTGCNMSMRRSVFDVVGTFDERIGRIGRVPLGCDETELCIRLAQTIPGAPRRLRAERPRAPPGHRGAHHLALPAVALLRRGAVQGADRTADRQQRRHLGGAHVRVADAPRRPFAGSSDAVCAAGPPGGVGRPGSCWPCRSPAGATLVGRLSRRRLPGSGVGS